MADNDEKTEDPTGRKLDKAREEGNVAKSREFSSAVLLFFGTLAMYVYVPYAVDNLAEMFTELFTFQHFTVDADSAYYLMYTLMLFSAKVTMPIMLLLMVLGVAANVLQTGFFLAPKAIGLKFERINPIKGFGKFFNKKSLVELIKSLAKVFIIGFAAVSIIKGKLSFIIHYSDVDAKEMMRYLALLLFELYMKLGLIVILIALADFFFQRWQFKQDMKMTKQEVKEEFKQMEGDQQVKSRIRSLQMEAARKRMMSDVPSADVVITNPTHYAVALKYDTKSGRAPMVIAKGQRLMALKIRELAKANGVYIHEEPPLARTLYKAVDIGDEIPENLYRAVAEILAFVYKFKNKKL